MSKSQQKVTCSALINAPLESAWDAWTDPQAIMQWNNASPDWHTPTATNDLRIGGRFCYTMAAKDESAQFDFEGTYTNVVPQREIAYQILDGREVKILFEQQGESVLITETFDPENENSAELQRAGWQSILDNFKRYAESVAHS